MSQEVYHVEITAIAWSEVLAKLFFHNLIWIQLQVLSLYRGAVFG